MADNADNADNAPSVERQLYNEEEEEGQHDKIPPPPPTPRLIRLPRPSQASIRPSKRVTCQDLEDRYYY